ncbi:MAG: hypothetical protein QM744_05555 [Mesorhizobium sp.]
MIEKLQGRTILAYDLPGHGRSLNYPNAGFAGNGSKGDCRRPC